VEDKAELMRKLGKKQLTLQLAAAAGRRAAGAVRLCAGAVADRQRAGRTPMTRSATIPVSHSCCRRWTPHGMAFKDLQTDQSSLEDIFVNLVRDRETA
jgi:ABC-2 type transport system ATP-binding protein